MLILITVYISQPPFVVPLYWTDNIQIDVQDLNSDLKSPEVKEQLAKTIAKLEEQLGVQLKDAGFDVGRSMSI